MENGRQVIEFANDMASLILNAENQIGIGEARQEKDRFKDGGLSRTVGADQQIDSAEVLQLNVFQPPEAAYGDALEMTGVRLLPSRRRRSGHRGSVRHAGRAASTPFASNAAMSPSP